MPDQSAQERRTVSIRITDGGAPETDEPETIGHFRIIQNLECGGLTMTSAAEDLRLPGRVVSLKVVLPQHVGTGLSQAIEHEARILAKFDHPSIERLLEFEASPRPYIASPLLTGCMLFDHFLAAQERTISRPHQSSSKIQDEERGPLRELVPARVTSSLYPKNEDQLSHVLKLIAAVARAIGVLHDAGVVHRDLRPKAIQITEEGLPVITHFESACDLSRLANDGLRDYDFPGTPYHTAPEQLDRGRGIPDGRADIYSLGVVLFECLTLNRPFDQPGSTDRRQAILFAEPPDVRSLNSTIPQEVSALVSKALARNRESRFQSAREFADQLERLCAHRETFG